MSVSQPAALAVDQPGAASPADGDDDGRARGRCAAHPSRLAADRCPHCSRRRCAADRARTPARCVRCAPLPRRSSGSARVLVAAGLAGMAVALVGGDIATQYVGDKTFELIVPLLVGVAAGLACLGAGALVGRSPRLPAAAVAVVAAVVGTGLSFRLVPGGTGPLHPAGTVIGPYVAAVVGVAVAVALAPVSRPNGPGRSRGRRRVPGR